MDNKDSINNIPSLSEDESFLRVLRPHHSTPRIALLAAFAGAVGGFISFGTQQQNIGYALMLTAVFSAALSGVSGFWNFAKLSQRTVISINEKGLGIAIYEPDRPHDPKFSRILEKIDELEISQESNLIKITRQGKWPILVGENYHWAFGQVKMYVAEINHALDSAKEKNLKLSTKVTDTPTPETGENGPSSP